MSGASLADYERAYEKAKGNKMVPASALAANEAVGLRSATPTAEAGEVQETVDRKRETSDLMWRINKYRTLTCENCGTLLRLPPSYDQPSVRCPHCGHINQV
jgi:heat shock protein HtpX